MQDWLESWLDYWLSCILYISLISPSICQNSGLKLSMNASFEIHTCSLMGLAWIIFKLNRCKGRNRTGPYSSIHHWCCVVITLDKQINYMQESGPGEKIVGPPSKDRQAKNLYTKSERLTLSFRVCWARSERVNSYNGQRMILPIKTKTCAT